MKFPLWFFKLHFFTIGVSIVVAYFAFLFIVTYLNHFSTTITVKGKNNYGMGRTLSNIIIDTRGNVYTVSNMYLVGNFDAVNDFAGMEVGKTYRISGYGISIPFLQIFPNINEISPA